MTLGDAHHREAVHTASEFAALIQWMGEPEVAAGPSLWGGPQGLIGKPVRRSKASGWRSALSTSRTATPLMGNFVIGSPLALGHYLARSARAMFLGPPRGGEADIERGVCQFFMVRSV